ncbi:DUF222 domain-containing protein [Arthrobacter sp. NPDC055585]
MTAMQLISESSRLCADAPETLTRLAEGKIGLQHARIILEETHNLPTEVLEVPDTEVRDDGRAEAGTAEKHSAGDPGQLDLGLGEPGTAVGADGGNGTEAGTDGGTNNPGTGNATTDESNPPADAGALSVRGAFERDLLTEAEGRTAAGFGRRARRLRESRFPDLIPVRHRQAKDKRRVMFQPLPDGMSCLSAIIAAEKGQAMFAALTGAAKAGKRTGDPRTMDQLRADTLTALLQGEPEDTETPTDLSTRTESEIETPPGSGSRAGSPAERKADTATGPRSNKRPRRAERHRNRNQNRSKVRTEAMVLINADTLAGIDENPAELNGYGPISAETARAMILEALHWTPLLQDPATGEILNVGRTRRIPAGLKRWLQARDGTCRFPGCSVTVTHAEIDHTKPFSHGGPTDHSNLEHLCPKHHRFKTLGHWKARQPEAGTIEWDSPTGRTYRTESALDFTTQETTVRLQNGARSGSVAEGRYSSVSGSDTNRWYGLGSGDTKDGSAGTATTERAQGSGRPDDEPPPF